MKWLITGGCGFIGRSLTRSLVRQGGHSIRVLDNLSVGSRGDLAAAASQVDIPVDVAGWAAPVTLTVGDVEDAAAVMTVAAGADVVVHLAANTGVPQSVENPVSDCQTNVMGTLNVLEACRQQGVPRMVFASSGAPLGVQNPPLHEELAPHPASPYGASKLAGEGYCSAYYQCFGVDAVVLRFGNVYGPGSGHKGSVVAKFIRQALAGEALEIYGDGSQSRDFIYIDDLVRAVQAAAQAPGVGGEIFQIATATETTVAELLRELEGALDAAGIRISGVVNGSSRVGDVARNFSDTSKARARLGWEAETLLPLGLRQTVQSFIQPHEHGQGVS